MPERPGFVPEHLRSNGKDYILFPQPGFLFHLNERFGKKTGTQLRKEYLAMIYALSSLEQEGYDFKFIRTATRGIEIVDGIEEEKTWEPTEDFIEHDTVEVRGLPKNSPEAIYTRDLFVTIGRHTFIIPDDRINIEQNESVAKSGLAEGGKVLVSGKSVLLAADLFLEPEYQSHIETLRADGYKFGGLIFAPNNNNIQRPNIPNVIDHIDGHTSLIHGKDNNTYLLYASSYANRHVKAREIIKKAAYDVEAKHIEIYDENLPFFAFNLIQTESGTIVVTSGANELTNALIDLVGKEKVITTAIPIVQFPRYFGASIRCMTNFCPRWLLPLLTKQVLFTCKPASDKM